MQQPNEKLLKEEIRDILVACAKSKEESVTYAELCSQIQTTKLDPYSSLLNKLLGEISSKEYAEGRGMLSVLVISQEDRRPGSGFFQLAKSLGRPAQDEEEFYINELNSVCQFWKTH